MSRVGGNSATDSTRELQALEAQLSLSRAALAERIFEDLGSGSSGSNISPSSSHSKKQQQSSLVSPATRAKGFEQKPGGSEKFHHRPPTLGLGAKSANTEAAQVARLSVEDARLKGRLASKDARRQVNSAAKDTRKRVVEDVDQSLRSDSDEEAEIVKAATKPSRGSAHHDPFASKRKQAKPTVPDFPDTSRSGKTMSNPHQDSAESEESQPHPKGITASAESKVPQLSKSRRKKLKKKRRLEEPGTRHEGERPCNAGEFFQKTRLNEAVGDGEKISRSADHEGSFLASQTVSYQPSTSLPVYGTTSSSTLSDHQRSLHAKLLGSHFRQLNESLYTSASADSFRRAQEEPTRMQSYHDGFREQVKKWPQKPFEKIGDCIADGVLADWAQMSSSLITSVSAKSAAKTLRVAPSAIPVAPIVADLGAGEGPLTRYLAQHPKLLNATPRLPSSLRPRIVAYDLLDTEDGVVRGVDCARPKGLPLPGTHDRQGLPIDAAIVDVAVFCLSLMGTDWVRMIGEARRILRVPGGQLIIAEVTSRLPSAADREAFVSIIEEVGFRRNTLDKDDKDDRKNTHFFMLRFTAIERACAHSLAAADGGNVGAAEAQGKIELLVERGREVLQACLYKRR